MARIYISSSYQDLKVEREAVRNAILRLGHMPLGMEAYNAADSPPLQRCLEDVAKCQYYVGICAWRHGFMPPGESRCITELEYEEAVRCGIPRFVFLLQASASWPIESTDEDRALVKAWRQRLEKQRMVAYFSTADELAGKFIATFVEQGLAKGPGAADIPPLLPYLCDRSRQEDALAEALERKATHPLVCIIHGNEYQSHDQLLRRIKEASLPRLLELDVAVSSYEIGWPADFASPDELHRLLARELAKKLLTGTQAPIEKIDAALQQLPGPVLVQTYVLTSDFERHGLQIIDAFLDFWQRWPELHPGRRLLALLSVQYEVREGARIGPFRRWQLRKLNRKIETMLEPPGSAPGSQRSTFDFSRFDRLNGVVLPLLEGVTRTEAESWARSNEVTRICASEELLTEVRALYQRYEEQAEDERIPMDTLGRELKSFLERHCLKETFA
jgi:hypothetical protein